MVTSCYLDTDNEQPLLGFEITNVVVVGNSSKHRSLRDIGARDAVAAMLRRFGLRR